jgi:hypothetical protein
MAAALRHPSSLALSGIVLATAVACVACDVKVGDKGMSVGVARETLTSEWSRSYPLAAGRFDLSVIGGAIDVTATDGPQLEVRVAQEATAMTKEAARQALESIAIRETAAPDHVSVDVQSGSPRGRVTIRTSVRLPRGVTSTVTARDGEIRLEGVDGTSTAAITNGTIFGRGVAGTLTASATNGRLVLDLARVTAPVTLTAKNGNINLGLPKDARADVEAMVLNGRISVDPEVPVVSDTRGDDNGRRGLFPTNQLSGRMNGGGPKLTINVTNGAVRIGPPGVVPPPRKR